MLTGDGTFDPTVFADIMPHLQTNLTQIRAYTQELGDPPHPCFEQAIRAQARFRGVAAAGPVVLIRQNN